MYLRKGIQPPDVVGMLLRSKFKQEREKRISTASFHDSLLKSTTSIKNVESHCINYMAKMIIFRQSNRYIGHVRGKNLQRHNKVIMNSVYAEKDLNGKEGTGVITGNWYTM